MGDTNTDKPVVVSEEHTTPETATGSPPPASTSVTILSSSPSPPTPQEITVEPTATTPRESPADPRVVSLRALFPDYDDTILQSVLESVDWNQDRAVDTLLIMSDPDYKPEPVPPQRPQRRHTAPAVSQEQLDEQFARQLLLQEEHQMSQWATSPVHGPPGTYPAWGQPGHPGGPAAQPAPHPQQPTGQGQGMAEFQEQFNKFAETGKKTIGSLLTKVKTKFQEFEQGRPSGPSNAQYPTQQWTSGPASYYGPPPPQSNQPPQSFQYAGPSSPVAPAPLPASSSSSSPPIDQTPSSETTPTPKTQPSTVPPAVTTAPPIDGGKLGLLPKRPVSLIRDHEPTVAEKSTTVDTSGSTTAPSGTTAKGYSVDDDDDDGLEYAENPFDEPAHKK